MSESNITAIMNAEQDSAAFETWFAKFHSREDYEIGADYRIARAEARRAWRAALRAHEINLDL